MKQEIEKIIKNTIGGEGFLSEMLIERIITLFPKWRVPSVDGWPKYSENVIYQEHEYPKLIMCGYGFHHSIKTEEGIVIECDRIKCWLPISEFLKIMEVNK